MSPRPRRALRRACLAGAAAVAALFASLWVPLAGSRFDPGPVVSLRLLDRRGALLREVLSDEGGRCRWVGLDDIPASLVKATIAAEDRAFFSHSGINLASIARALGQNLRRGRIVSGASTITQQVVRSLYRHPRRWPAKILEAWLSLRLERTLSKPEILTQYLNRIPYGNQAFGVEAAARLYFGKPAAGLGLAESAYLAVIPRSPSTLDPFRHPEAVLARQRRLLVAMAELGLIERLEAERAAAEPIRLVPPADSFRAPHFCDYVLARLGRAAGARSSDVRTTLDLDLQEKVERLVERHLSRLGRQGATNAAVIVLDNGSGDILAMAGSRSFFDAAHDGQVNGALSPRQPGSALKPIVYALALEQGFTAASIIDDVPTEFAAVEGGFAPENYDLSYHGPVRLRSALASSYNVPAVAVLDLLGPDRLYRKLKDLSFESLSRAPGHYGLGLALGDGEVTLLELARAYAVLARGGLWLPERALLEREGPSDRLPGDAPAEARRVLTAQASYIVTNILADRDARVPGFGYASPLEFPFPVAAKTGTSKDYRDNWTAGYTVRQTVAVWVGNFDGAPMHGVSGVSGAAPLFRDIVLELSASTPAAAFREPPGMVRVAICPRSGLRRSARCPSAMDEIFAAGTEPSETCPLPHRPGEAVSPAPARRAAGAVAIAFPSDGDVFKLDPVLRPEFQSVRLRAEIEDPSGAAAEVEWWIDGRLAGRSDRASGLVWRLRPGSYTIKARAVVAGAPRESRPVRVTVIG